MDFSKYIGIPYDKYNCWGIIRQVYDDGPGIHLDEDIYKASVDFIEIWYDGEGGDTPDLRPYDVILMRRLKPFVEHVACMVDGDRYLHARPRTGVCIEPFDRWKHKVAQIVRHRHMQ